MAASTPCLVNSEITAAIMSDVECNDVTNANSGDPDSPDPHVNKSSEPPDDVCRDFLRNVCRRGASCRFRHPEGCEAVELGKQIEYVFCHDFQNRECRRANCRFVHATKEEEETYRGTGKLPQHCLDKIVEDGGHRADLGAPDAIPVCKDYLKGDCRRPPGRCKFRHMKSPAEMEMRHPSLSIMNAPGHPSQSSGGGPYAHPDTAAVYQHPQQFTSAGINANGFNPYSSAPVYAAPSAASSTPVFRNSANFGNSASAAGQNARSFDGYVPEPKRRAYESTFHAKSGASNDNGFPHSLSAVGSGPSNRYLEEENQALRRRIDELKQQVSALSSQNDYLIATNAALKASLSAQVSVSSAATVSQSAYSTTCDTSSIAAWGARIAP